MTETDSLGGSHSAPPQSDDVVLEIRRARRSFGDLKALDGVDLKLSRRSIYTLLGPNGAGKTTLLRSICGRIRLDSGTVLLDGQSPIGRPDVRKRLGFVPQEIALYPDLTARENLEIFGGLAGLTRSEASTAAGELLDRVQLAGRSKDPVRVLSGGMKRRLNIAAGVIHRPTTLLLDEPTVGIDPSAREQIHDLLRDLKVEGLAILLTTHDLEQAAELADVIGILIDGRLRAEGSLEGLIRGVFGDGREVSVTLAETPSPADPSLLSDLGFEPTQAERSWSGRLEGGLADLSGLGETLEASGLEIAELRVREPSLRGVFFHHAGREIDS